MSIKNTKIDSLPFNNLPYSIQCRLTELTPPETLQTLHQTGQTIYKRATLKNYYAETLSISPQYVLDSVKDKLNALDYGLRFLTPEEAIVQNKIIRVRRLLSFFDDLQFDKEKLLPLFAPTYSMLFVYGSLSISDMARLIHPGLESCAYWARNMELTQEDCDVLTKMLLEYVAIPDRRFLCRSINGFDAFFEEFRPLLENNPEYRVYGDDDGFYIAPIN